jgi:hypothetical protein
VGYSKRSAGSLASLFSRAAAADGSTSPSTFSSSVGVVS